MRTLQLSEKFVVAPQPVMVADCLHSLPNHLRFR